MRFRHCQVNEAEAVLPEARPDFLSSGLKPKRTSIASPWQNGIAERWVGSCRRELFDHVIPLNERHLRRLVREYVAYFEQDRIYDALDKDTPQRRPIEKKPCSEATVISSPRFGGDLRSPHPRILAELDARPDHL